MQGFKRSFIIPANYNTVRYCGPIINKFFNWFLLMNFAGNEGNSL